MNQMVHVTGDSDVNPIEKPSQLDLVQEGMLHYGSRDRLALEKLLQKLVEQGRQKPAEKPGDTLEDNVRYLLSRCPFTLRDMSGERTGVRGKEDLVGSLTITFLGMEQRLREAQGQAHVDSVVRLAETIEKLEPAGWLVSYDAKTWEYHAENPEGKLGEKMAIVRPISFSDGSDWR